MQYRPLAALQPAWSHSSLSRPGGYLHLSSRALGAQAVPSRPSSVGDDSSSSSSSISLSDSQWGELTTAAPPKTSSSSGSRRAPGQPVTSRPSRTQSSSRDREDSRGAGSNGRFTGNGKLESPPAAPRSSEQRQVGTSGDQHGGRQRFRSTHTAGPSSRASNWEQGRDHYDGFSHNTGPINSYAASSSRSGSAAAAVAKRQPDQKAKKAAGLAASNQPCCYGCGAPLQTVAPAAAGYVVPTKFELKQKHKQLNQVLCVRCSELCNGAMIPAVQDFTQKVWAQQQAGMVQQKQQQQRQQQEQQKQPDFVIHGSAPAAGQWAGSAAAADLDFQGIKQCAAADAPETLLGKVLITPEQLRDKISEVRGVKAVVVLLVDLLDASGTLMSKVRDMVGNNPIILVGTKMDLLPADCHPKDVAGWLSESASRKKLQVASCHLVSSHTGEGIATVIAKVCRERKGRDVFVVGAANVGKSAFVRAMLKEMSSLTGGNFDAAAMSTSRYLPVESAMPGTTLGLIALKAFETGGTLYDTPGVHLHHRVPHMLAPDELKLLQPRRRLTAFIPPPPLEVMSQHTKQAADNVIVDGGRSWDKGGPAWSTDPRTGVSKPRSVAATYMWGGLVRIDVLSAPPSTHLVFYGPKALKVFDLPLLGGGDQLTFDLDTVQPGQELFGQESVGARGGLVSRDLTVPAPAVPTNACLADIAVSGLPGWIGVYSQYTKRDIHLKVWTPRGVEIFLRPPLPCPTPQMSGASEDPPELLEIGGALDVAEADQEWVAHKESLGLRSMSKQDEEVVKMLLFGDEAAGLSGLVDEDDEIYGADPSDSDDNSDHHSGETLLSDDTANKAAGVDVLKDGVVLQQLVAGVPVSGVGANAKTFSSNNSSPINRGTMGGIDSTSRYMGSKTASAVAYDDEFGSIYVDAGGNSSSGVVAESLSSVEGDSAGNPTRRRRIRRNNSAS